MSDIINMGAVDSSHMLKEYESRIRSLELVVESDWDTTFISDLIDSLDAEENFPLTSSQLTQLERLLDEY